MGFLVTYYRVFEFTRSRIWLGIVINIVVLTFDMYVLSCLSFVTLTSLDPLRL